MSEPLFDDEVIENHYVTKRDRRTKRELAAENQDWEKVVGVTTPGHQLSCGSCWSFPNVSPLYFLILYTG